MKVKKADVRPILKATFPNYKGRTFEVKFVRSVTFHDTNWGGGTRNYYVAIASDGRTATPNIPAPWKNMVEGSTVELTPDILVVEHSIFCGKDLGITIYANPTHQPKWLTEGAR